MNAKISGIKEGDRVEIECTAAAKTAEAYQTGHRDDRPSVAAQEIIAAPSAFREDGR